MKIVLILVGLLLLGSGGYLFSVQSSTTLKTQMVTDPLPVSEVVADSMCTSTACMKKAELSASNTSIGKPESAEPVVTKTPVAQAVVETIKKVIPVPPTTPPVVKNKYTDFINPSGFINSEPFSLADYVGKKLILVEFITYSCINCQRTFPYLQSWHEMYKEDGLLVIGIHTPEFAYEQNRDNVVAALKKEGITFPVVMDNRYETWNAYENRFWPHRYIIDYDGQVVFDHIGEGAYEETEDLIGLLLEQQKTLQNS